jgi:3'(2'), 5'-bisphosphate nucleotidase
MVNNFTIFSFLINLGQIMTHKILETLKLHQKTLLASFEKAGDEILKIYKEASPDIQRKSDNSPLTQADLIANEIITKTVKELFPDIPLISEEEKPEDISKSDYFFLLDPLDGTKEFINKFDDFTVNLGLIYRDEPIFGMVSAPVYDTYYIGDAVNKVALIKSRSSDLTEIKSRPIPDQGRIMVTSRHHANNEKLEQFKKEHHISKTTAKGSSLKICEIACGEADFYPRFGPTMEWDTAAAHAVLTAAGGSLTTIDGKKFAYRKDGFLNPGFLAKGVDK